MLNTFSSVYWPYVYPWKNVSSDSLPILNQAEFSLLSYVSLLNKLSYINPYQIYKLQIFYPIQWVPFCEWFLLVCGAFELDIVLFVYFCSSCLCFSVSNEKNHRWDLARCLLHMFFFPPLEFLWFQVFHSNLETKSKVDYAFDLVFVYGIRWASLVAHG